MQPLTAHPAASQLVAQGAAHNAVVAEHSVKQSIQLRPLLADFSVVKHPFDCGRAPRTLEAKSQHAIKSGHFMVDV